MRFLPRLTIIACAIFLIGVPALAAAQGVETEPTGVDDFVPELKENKKTDEKQNGSGWLGVMLDAPEDEDGVDVVRVIRSSPAEKAGLQKGDRILRVDDQSVSSSKDVQTIVGSKRAGQETSVELRRADQTKSITLTLGTTPGVDQLLRGQFVGHSAPSFNGQLVGEDGTVELSELTGKPVVVDFWATWCGPCRPMSQKLAKLHDQVGDKAHFIGLTSETEKTVQRYLANNEHGFPVATTDEEIMQAYLIESYPTVFVIDAEGRVAGVFVGLGHGQKIEKLVDKLTDDTAEKTAKEADD